MAKCADCKGRGFWTEQDESFGEVEIMQRFCFTCGGTGKQTNDDDIDDFDLAGVGATEGDDNE